jgi:acetolactate synthase-1/2/3 large subunit
MFEIARPDLNWVQLAKGMGVPAVKVTSLETFGVALQAGSDGDGPSLIEVPL